jgi:hypothetical protein
MSSAIELCLYNVIAHSVLALCLWPWGWRVVIGVSCVIYLLKPYITKDTL